MTEDYLSDYGFVFFRAGDYDLMVDWGDGTEPVPAVNTLAGPDPYDTIFWVEHTYETPGQYDITFTGSCPGPGQPYYPETIIDVKQWGRLAGAADWSFTFDRCVNLVTISATDGFCAGYTNFRFAFYLCENLNAPILSTYDTSNITNMEGMFAQCYKFNQPLDSWDIHGVTSTTEMFTDCREFNQTLKSWDVSTVASMRIMFSGCLVFDQDLSCWDVQHISSPPSNFARNCPINDTAKMPKWGQTPNTGCV